MFDLLQYSFVIRGIEAGMIVAFISPLIGIFLVLRRYSLIADTLSHISLAGVALGFLCGINPIWTATGVSVSASLGIEYLRTSKRIYGESALALFMSGALAVATILLSFGKGFNSSVFNYLFGSIVTVTQTDVYTIAILALIIFGVLLMFFKELIFISFDEESARVSGIAVDRINRLLIVLSALTVALAIPIVGVLLISALIVIPVVAALQLKKSFFYTIIYAEIISICSVLVGIFISFYLNLSTGGTIVLIMLAIFLLIMAGKKLSMRQ